METVLSGIQPTGKLHLGNYIGAIQNWVNIQNSGKYKCIYMIADVHSLTLYIGKYKEINDNVIDIYMDLLSCGIDLEKSILFVQSAVPAHFQLHLILSMLTPLGWLERNPTFKEKIKELKDKELNNYGFLGYPVLQAADILLYKGEKVPVGMDQLPHLEITREIARRFNYFYNDYFPEPQPLLTPVPKLSGTDGRKMSKSYNNAIYLSDTPETITNKLKKFITDTNKIYKNDPGNPDNCTVYPLYKIFADEEKVKEVEIECKKGALGCVQCKKNIANIINKSLEKYREKKSYFLSHKDEVKEWIVENNRKANEIATKTINEVYELIGLNYE